MNDKKGNCPHCKKLITELNVAKVTLNDELWGSKNGYSYSCPSCQSLLSVGFDLAALNSEIQKAVESALRKHLRT